MYIGSFILCRTVQRAPLSDLKKSDDDDEVSCFGILSYPGPIPCRYVEVRRLTTIDGG